MKVLMLNGSPKANGNTALALKELEKVFAAEGIEVETVQLGNKPIRGCVACGGCYKAGRCVLDDSLEELAAKFQEADGLVVASPVYYASANATLIAALDRLFYSTRFDKTMKVGAAVVAARDIVRRTRYRCAVRARADVVEAHVGVHGLLRALPDDA